MIIKIIIYTGKKGSGKTTQLATHLYGDMASKRKIVAERQIMESDGQKFLAWDDIDFKKDLAKIPDGIDWLYLSAETLPKNYKKQIYKRFKEDVYDVRECMFPLCNYINKEGGLYYADFGALRYSDVNKEDLIKHIDRNESKEVAISNKEEMKSFLEANKLEPRNFIEWGLDYAFLMQFKEKFDKMTGDVINVTMDEASAISNYNACEIEWIEDLFFNLFMCENDTDDLRYQTTK